MCHRFLLGNIHHLWYAVSTATLINELKQEPYDIQFETMPEAVGDGTAADAVVVGAAAPTPTHT